MQPPSPEQAQESLREHVIARAQRARQARAVSPDAAAVIAMLDERACVRYPVGVRFDAQPLRPGEFACLEALGELPSDGYCLFIHPMFEPVDDLLPLLIAYYIPTVNYGEVASHAEAELFGATLTGLDLEEYYKILCSVADSAAAAGGGPGPPIA